MCPHSGQHPSAPVGPGPSPGVSVKWIRSQWNDSDPGNLPAPPQGACDPAHLLTIVEPCSVPLRPRKLPRVVCSVHSISTLPFSPSEHLLLPRIHPHGWSHTALWLSLSSATWAVWLQASALTSRSHSFCVISTKILPISRGGHEDSVG